MRRNSLLIALVVALVALALVVAVVWAMNRGREQTQTQQPQGTATVQQRLTTADFGKPKPVAETFLGCPPSGDGGDPVLNTLKNRIDEGQWNPSSVEEILALPWPKAIEGRPRSRWSKADAEAIARHEGSPVQLEGYLVTAKKMSPETCNCHSVEHVDFHIWLVDDDNKGREQSVVIETTPRVMAHHPAWTLKRIKELAARKDKVRISGWLMMDPEHPDQIGKTRGAIWEIHPVMQIETRVRGGWKPLDDGTTGVSSAPAVNETIPPLTPESTATFPPVADPQVQDAGKVEIVTVSFDGKKGSNEPDEYVEITNKGAQQVDITDWVLQDAKGENFYKWESYVLQPGATIRVYTNEVHDDSGGFTFQSKSAIWANKGDVAELFDADKEPVSRYAYGNKK